MKIDEQRPDALVKNHATGIWQLSGESFTCSCLLFIFELRGGSGLIDSYIVMLHIWVFIKTLLKQFFIDDTLLLFQSGKV
jgi:hypothetical protein